MPTVRICTIEVPRFVHDGLEVVEAWRPVDIAKLAKPARQTLVDYTGRFIQIHPEDLGELAKVGLEIVQVGEGRKVLRPIAAKAAAKT
jgi:hypothetical protein